MFPVRPSTTPASECLLRGATVRYADRVVLREVDLSVGRAERLAVIGDNGSGKSTLLGVLAGSVSLVAGERRVSVPGGIALAEQHPQFDAGATVGSALDCLLSDLRDLETAIQSTSDQIAASTSDRDSDPALLDRLADLTDRFEARDGYGVDHRVAVGLQQLGLGDLDRTRPVADLSGGERARLALVAALASQAELLLLDEPTNDLDDDGIAWLEQRLEQHRGSLVVVTHDRAFLDRFATAVLVVADAGLRRYGNGYAGYLTARAAERERLIAEHEAWRSDLARHEALISANAFRLDAIPRKAEKAGFGHGAFKPRGRDHGAMGRIRNAKERVARLHADPAPRPADPLRFRPAFSDERMAPDEPVLRADAVRLDEPALELPALAIEGGDRLLVSGHNGAGKSTLLRLLAGELSPTAGSLDVRAGTRVAWLRQDLPAPPCLTVIASFAARTGTFADEAAEHLVGLGLFAQDDLDREVGQLSVGQRRRLELAVVISSPSDLLLLDEPTNHLAPELVDQLESALVDHPGAVVTVTHDRLWRDRAEARSGVRRLHVGSGGVVTGDHI